MQKKKKTHTHTHKTELLINDGIYSILILGHCVMILDKYMIKKTKLFEKLFYISDLART